MKKCKKQLTVFLSVLLLAIAGGAVLHRKEK